MFKQKFDAVVLCVDRYCSTIAFFFNYIQRIFFRNCYTATFTLLCYSIVPNLPFLNFLDKLKPLPSADEDTN